MNTNRKFVIILEIFVIAFLVMSVVSVCGLSYSSVDISAYPSIVNPGDEITVTYSDAPGFELDWIAMYKVGDPNEEEYDMGYYLAGEKSGTLIFTAPDEPGDYEFRLFEDDGYTDIARSNIVTVQEGTSVSTPTPTIGDTDISASPSIVNPGDEITVTYSGAPGFELDWIAMYKVGDPNEGEYGEWQYLEGEKSGKLRFTAPDEPGDYEFRLFEDDGYTDIARSNVVTVQEGTTPATPPPIAEEGLVAHYPFDGDYKDYSGNDNDGIPKGSMAFTDAELGKGASFDGKSWIEVSDSDTLDLSTALTFSVWLYKQDAGTGGWAVVFSKGDTYARDSNSPYALLHSYDGKSPSIGLVKNNYVLFIESTAKTNFSVWYLLTVTWDGADIKYYINGELKDTKEWVGTLPNSDSKLLIGSHPPGATEYFRGVMDDLRIYDHALSADEIKALYVGKESPAPSPTPAISSGKGDCKDAGGYWYNNQCNEEEEESGYGDIKVTYISWEEVQEKYTVSYDETFKYDDDGDGANEATLYYKGENNLVMSSDDTDKDGKVDLIFHYDDEEYLTRAIRDTDGDGEFDQILHFNRDEEIIKVEKIRSDDTRNSILFIILGSILFFLVMCCWLYVTKKQSYNSKINHQLGRRLILISISFLIIFALLVSPVSSQKDVIDDDCNIIQDVFDREWKKYSDFENTPLTFEEFPLKSRSTETQQYYATQSKILDAKVQIFLLKRDMEIDLLMRRELKEYEKELKDGHRDNILKSFMRLSFLTVHTVYEAGLAGKSVGDSYVNLFTNPSNLAAAGSVLKITDTYKSMAPPKSTALAKNTQSITKSVDAIKKKVAYETLESLGNPTKAGTELVKGVIDAVPVPHKAKEWKLTDDDFNILREEHLEMKRIGRTIAESYKVNIERNDKVREFEAQIKELEKELAEWEAKEKSRVKAKLVDSCKDEKKEKCDSEHLSLCDNENDCEDASGYWYNNNCNEEEQGEEKPLDVTTCESIEGQYKRYECYYDLATEKVDASICDLMIDDPWYGWRERREECYCEVAVLAQDSSICDKIRDIPCYYWFEWNCRYACYGLVAESKQDASICAQIPDVWSANKDSCYRQVADSKLDTSFCDEIKNHYNKDYCYGSIAVLKQDASICAKIQSQRIRENCYRDVSNKP